MIVTVAKRNYALIGRILYKTFPDIASQLEEKVKPGDETDVKRVFFFFSRFDGLELTGYNSVNKRRLFTAVMLKLYHPCCFTSEFIKVKYGFIKNIAACFSAKQEAVSRSMREAIIMYRAYEDFKQKVNEVVEYLKSNN